MTTATTDGHPHPVGLAWDAFDLLPEHVQHPTYTRAQLSPGIVHFGVGGFHRAHEAMYLDRLMNQGRALDYGIVGVGTMPGDARMRDALRGQDHLYTLLLKHPDGRREARVIGSIVDYLFAPDDPQAVLERLCDPTTRIVSLTVTEGGYHVNRVTGELDSSDPALCADLVEPHRPRTVFGFLVEALRRRRAARLPPFTVMSCDNLPGNGDTARTMISAFAALRDEELARWIGAEVAFPNSMVDRITPVTTEEDVTALAAHGVEDAWPVVCEPFTQWVVEDHFPAGRPPFEEAGVQLVEDVTAYELMKLRLLNASHQAIAYLGTLAGYRQAHEVCRDPVFAEFALGYMEHEGSPTLPPVPGVDLGAYRHQLIERFANPHVRDSLARLCAESSDRIPTWLVPVIRENLAAGRPVERAALVVASWARYAEGVDEQGRPLEVVDRREAQVRAAAAARHKDPLAFLRDPDLFSDLSTNDRFTGAYLRALASLHEHGASATVTALVERGVRPSHTVPLSEPEGFS